MIRLIFWLFAALLALTLMSFVVFAFVSVVAVVILIQLIAWTCRGLSRWADRSRSLPETTRYPVAAYTPRTPTADEVLRAEVANIVDLRGEGRFITELDEKLGNVPDPSHVRQQTPSRHHPHVQGVPGSRQRRHFRAPRPRAGGPAASHEFVAQLRELEQLWTAGALTGEEFALAKARLLRS
jgi:hypothetical protein